MFEILSVPPNAAEAPEQMGTKQKFWFQHPELGPCLFKLARPDTGEDWSEKVACELARRLGLPHAEYEMAEWNGHPGSLSKSMLPRDSTLIHGNELLSQLATGYATSPITTQFRNSGHTLPLVISTIEKSGAAPPLDAVLPEGVETAVDVFVGYLLLDALVGNTDRHHENWAVVERRGFELEELTYRRSLAPTYDHASCLGRNELDARRKERLVTRDRRNTVEAYAERCASALYRSPGDSKPLLTLDAFIQASELRPRAAEAWRARLGLCNEADFAQLLALVPRERCSSIAVEFAMRILEYNRNRLLETEILL